MSVAVPRAKSNGLADRLCVVVLWAAAVAALAEEPSGGADAEDVPRPFRSELITPWGAGVNEHNAWREYPRPQMVRREWQNLNGLWDYAVTPRDRMDAPSAREWNGKILVPFSLEAKLGRVERLLRESEALWYRREFDPRVEPNQRLLLHFEAVDYFCTVWVNGTKVGTHRGGFSPFSFDITDALRPGRNQLVVRVEDATEAWQLRGKQVRKPQGIWYTRVSGIWQTVWLEPVPTTRIDDLHIATDDSGVLDVSTMIVPAREDVRIELAVFDGEREVARRKGRVVGVRLQIPQAKLWSPQNPHLYRLVVQLLDGDDRPIDQVASYAGIRSVGRTRDTDGHWRFTLNGKPIFHLGPLDQGWWPDGLLTPPSDEAIRFELEFLKAAGFNMLRKHIKVEPRRYYYHCDRLGLMVWQDHVSDGHNPPWTRLKPGPFDADWPAEHHRQFMLELERMVDNLENHPSIVVWVPFNEAWSQHRTVEVGKWLMRRDRSRLVNVASGGNFWPVGHVVDHHEYPHPKFPFDARRYRSFIMVVGEFGGHGFPFRDHLWDARRRNWGYGGLPKTREEYKTRYRTSLRMLGELRRQGIAAGVYTQTSDVEGEINGLLTYDRRIIKIPAQELKRIARETLGSLTEEPQK